MTIPELPELALLTVEEGPRQRLATALAGLAVQLADDLVGYGKRGLTNYSIESSRKVLRELVELIILLDPDLPLPELPEIDATTLLTDAPTVEARP